MEKKSTAKANVKKRASLGEYFKGVKIEMKKVVWPDKAELVSYTGVVILTCSIFALVFWAFDSAFLALLRAVLNIGF